MNLECFLISNGIPQLLPTSFLAILNRINIDDVPAFTRRTALSAMPFVSDLCGVDFHDTNVDFLMP